MLKIINEFAGALRLCPDKFTVKELWEMMDGHRQDAWLHTSSMMAMMHNLQCSKPSQMKDPEVFNPMIEKKAKPLTKEQTTHMLKQYLHMATKGNFVEKKERYVQNEDGAWVCQEVKD